MDGNGTPTTRGSRKTEPDDWDNSGAGAFPHNPSNRELPWYDPLELLLMTVGVVLITLAAVTF